MELPKEDAEYHMKRCIDSGLWVANAADLENDETGKDANGVKEEEEEETYDEID